MKLTQYLNGFVMLTSENTRLTEVKKKQCNPAFHTGNAYNIKPGMRDTERFIALTEREMEYLYGRTGSFHAILEAEPFTRMKSVEMENLLENYREKLEGQRLERSIN
jgi:hypothetical protein